MEFIEILGMQKQLDEAVGKPRENGFEPKKRNFTNIKLSMIAEIIEFNEETEETHKTWKQKEFDKSKMIEEAVDITFFLAQLINLDTQEEEIKVINKCWESCWSFPSGDFAFEDILHNQTLKLLEAVSRTNSIMISNILDIIFEIVRLYRLYDIDKETIYAEYKKKWNKNMKRINKDWTLGGNK